MFCPLRAHDCLDLLPRQRRGTRARRPVQRSADHMVRRAHLDLPFVPDHKHEFVSRHKPKPLPQFDENGELPLARDRCNDLCYRHIPGTEWCLTINGRFSVSACIGNLIVPAFTALYTRRSDIPSHHRDAGGNACGTYKGGNGCDTDNAGTIGLRASG